MSKKEAVDEEKDEHGLTVQKYTSRVLVVVPSSGFSEETLRHARSSLFNVHVGTWCVSSRADETITGRLQDLFLVDGPLSEVDFDDFSGVVLVAGTGDAELAQDPAVLELVRAARRDGKLLAAWGTSVAVLLRAGVAKGLKLTGARSLADDVRRAGARYTGVEVQRDGTVVTARDESAGLRFGKALAQVVAIL